MGKRRNDPVSDEEEEAIESGDESEMEKPSKVKKQKVRTPLRSILLYPHLLTNLGCQNCEETCV